MIGIEISHLAGVPVARVPVEVDAANARRVRAELAAAMQHEAFELVVDLSDTRFIDSAGLDMLFRLNQTVAERRGTLRVVIPADSRVRRVADLVGLAQAMPVHESVADAIAAAGPSPAAEPEE